MKFNFKKIASVLATTVMLGSTVAFASAAWPAPFVDNGAADAALVVGVNAAATDMAAATDIGAALDSKVTAGTGTISGTGDKAGIDSSSRRIYYGDGVNASKSSLSSSEMPTVLADGKVTDLSGIDYKYTQYIVFGDTPNVFGTSGGDLNDPVLYLDVGTTATDPIYNYSLSFTKNINVSDATNVQGQKIKILGVDYVLGASSTNSTLYLYGAGETVTFDASGSKTVTIAGKEHTVEFVGATAATTAKISIDGVSKTVTKGSSYSFAGDVNVYVKDVTYQSYAGGLQSIELIVGANTLLLQDGNSVKVGAEQTTVQGTKVKLTSDSSGLLSGIIVQVAANKTQLDSISIGGSMTDPVFGGLKVQFVSANPALTDASRAKVKVSTDNNQYAYVTFTSARNGGKGEQQLTFAYDNDTSASVVTPQLAHQTITSGKGLIHVLEGENASVNDWIVVNQGDSGTILSVDDISIDSVTSGSVTLTDVITGDSQKIALSNVSNTYTKTGVNFFGGNGYTISANGAGTAVNITWNSAPTRSLFPRIKLANGGWISFLTEKSLAANTTLYVLPDGQNTLSAGYNFTGASPTITNNGITWGTRLVGSTLVLQNVSSATNGAGCNFSALQGPSILIMEPKKWNDASQGDFICVPMVTQGTKELAIGRSVLNGTNSGFISYTSDNYKSAAVDQYGTFVTDEQRTNENGVATIYMPTSQMYMDIKFTADSVTSGSQKIKVVTDSEVSSVSGNNLIVVGGSCINKAAAMILTGKEDALCGSAFSAATNVGVGKYLIQVAASPYAANKKAVLVAGYDAVDTTTAAAKVVKDGVDASTNGATVYPLAA